MKQKILSNINKYGFLSISIVIMLFYMMNSLIQLNSKTQFHYCETKLNYQEKEIYWGQVERFNIKPIAEEMQNYKISLVNNQSSGQLAYSITDTDDNLLKYKDYILEGNSEEIDIDVSDLNLKKNATYYLNINLISVDKITVKLNNNAELQADMVFEFKDTFLFNFIIIFLLIVFVILFFSVFRAKNIYKKFAVLSLTIGIIFLFVVPPCTVPDEWRHFVRAYDITEGNAICTSFATKAEFDYSTFPTCKIPSELFQVTMISQNNSERYDAASNDKIVYERWRDVMSQKVGDITVETPIHGTSSISPIAYLPQIIGIFAGKAFGSYVGGIVYLAKFGNLLFATLIGLLALYITPKFKEGIFILWFIPFLVHLRSSNSTDSILFAFILLILAIFIKTCEEGKLENKYYIIAILAVIFISQIKVPYILSSLIFLFCGKNKNCKFNRIFAVSSFVIGCLSYEFFNIINSVNTGVSNSSLGLNNYIHDFTLRPFYHINLLFQAFVNDSWTYLKNSLAFDGEILKVCFLVCILITMKYCTDTISTTPKYKMGCIVGSLFMWAAILGIFAINSYRVSYSYLWGVQARYLLPILPFFFLGIAQNNTNKNQKLFSCIELAIITILLIYTYWFFNIHWI